MWLQSQEKDKQPISTTPCALVAEHINTDFLSALLTTLASVLTLSSRQGNTRVFALKLREIRSLWLSIHIPTRQKFSLVLFAMKKSCYGRTFSLAEHIASPSLFLALHTYTPESENFKSARTREQSPSPWCSMVALRDSGTGFSLWSHFTSGCGYPRIGKNINLHQKNTKHKKNPQIQRAD